MVDGVEVTHLSKLVTRVDDAGLVDGVKKRTSVLALQAVSKEGDGIACQFENLLVGGRSDGTTRSAKRLACLAQRPAASDRHLVHGLELRCGDLGRQRPASGLHLPPDRTRRVSHRPSEQDGDGSVSLQLLVVARVGWIGPQVEEF